MRKLEPRHRLATPTATFTAPPHLSKMTQKHSKNGLRPYTAKRALRGSFRAISLPPATPASKLDSAASLPRPETPSSALPLPKSRLQRCRSQPARPPSTTRPRLSSPVEGKRRPRASVRCSSSTCCLRATGDVRGGRHSDSRSAHNAPEHTIAGRLFGRRSHHI